MYHHHHSSQYINNVSNIENISKRGRNFRKAQVAHLNPTLVLKCGLACIMKILFHKDTFSMNPKAFNCCSLLQTLGRVNVHGHFEPLLFGKCNF